MTGSRVTFRTRLALFDKIKVTFRDETGILRQNQGYIPDKTRWEMEIF